MPVISVILPNYNHASFLEERIESIINQSFDDFELIIIDDASTDGSQNILHQYDHHPSVTHIVYEQQNSGSPFVQWNKGVDLAQGEWIWIAESDDSANPDLLQRLYQLTTHNPELVLAYCQSNKMNKDGNITGTWKEWTDDLDYSLFMNDFIMNGREYTEKFLIHQNTIPNASAVLFRKQSFLSVGRVDEDIKNCSDWLLWLKLATQGDIAYCAACLNNFRYNDTSVIASAVKAKRVSFFKKFDIEMRTSYNAFLKRQRTDFNPIRKENNLMLALEIAQECRWLVTKKNWTEVGKYMIRYLSICFAEPRQMASICLKTVKLFRIFQS